MPNGLLPTATVVVTTWVVVSMIETVFSPELATYNRLPSGVMATPNGASPTMMVAVTALLAASITEMLSCNRLVT